MTTVAYDGSSIAADTIATAQCGLKRTVHKLYKGRRYVYGGTGELPDVQRIANWIMAGAKPEDAPENKSDTGGLVVERRTGKAWIVCGEPAIMLPLSEPQFAVGNGRDFALAAMACGKTAKQAVEIAIRFNVFSGGEVDVIKIR